MQFLKILLLVLAVLPGVMRGAEQLDISYTTSDAGGGYRPRNVTVIWIEDGSGNFVRTLGRWAGGRVGHLIAWRNSYGGTDTDAVSGATRPNHTPTLVVSWDMKDSSGAYMPDGTYRIRMELADRNSSSASQNNQGTFTFTKNGTADVQTTNGGGFNNVFIDYTGRTPSTGVVELSSVVYNGDEQTGTVTVTVNRMEGSMGIASVTIDTVDGSAVSGNDFTGLSGYTIDFADGEIGNRKFDIAIINDGTAESQETFQVVISNVTGAVSGTLSVADVTITDAPQTGSSGLRSRTDVGCAYTPGSGPGRYTLAALMLALLFAGIRLMIKGRQSNIYHSR